MVKCMTEEPGQAKIRFQFGVWDAVIKHWECCPMSRVALNLQTSEDLLSVGHRDLSILKRHIDTSRYFYLVITDARCKRKITIRECFILITSRVI